jgi:hypothetical protein
LTRSRLIALLTLVLIGAVFIAGYWPEHRRRVAVEQELSTVRPQLNDSAARLRIADLLGQTLHLIEVVTALNYSEAQQLSTKFFDDVRTESGRTPHPDFKTTLEGILQNRDGVTSALARGDSTVADVLRKMQLQLRQMLGYPTRAPAS